ncbi:MAG: RagB/SusD family nutrient uptake outer membrane protein [Tannerella sp.]|jgi:hypothetical protein|nr:RagB/SusD family nutrient uptake outer membrane protein [Tannerella sp.]
MKKKFAIITTVMAGALAGCGDYLDTYPGDKYDDATVWENAVYAEQFVFNIYQGIPYPHQWYMSGALTDEQVPNQVDGVVTRVTESNLTPDDLAAFADNWGACMDGWWWDKAYSRIRACNKFLEEADGIPFPTREKTEQLTGEVHFLRAWFHFLLMAQYGGVILMDKSVDMGDDYAVPRSSFEETVNFIVKDLDAAIDSEALAGQADKTRATTGAALALKSRVLLYAASDMHHNLAWAGSYANPELIGYPNSTADLRNALFEEAGRAAGLCMERGYSLYDADGDKAKNFSDLFLQIHSDEQIFITRYDKLNWGYWATDWPAWVTGPPSFGGYALNTVTANLANAFENADGTPFDWEMQRWDPYSGRDPRFDGSVLHNYSQWYAWGYENRIDIAAPWGADYVTPENQGTGYFMKKFISPLENDWYYGTPQPQPYIQIRYAEVLLNYAEACLALGRESAAREALNMIRGRAGMPEIPASESGEALLARYRNERRVELAFEGHRFFDVRRWLIAPEAYVPARGVSFDYSEYTEIVVDPNRKWNDSHYLIPIQRTEINRNPKLIQNPLYK